ncbi:MAG: SDR family oxidoreductase [Pseudomonadota bacterium]
MSKGKALVTGASAGIGAATARALAADGWTVHATARRAAPLEALAAEGVVTHVLDANDREGMAALAAAEQFDLIVANAGRGAAMTGLSGASAEEIEAVVTTNVTSVLHLLNAALPGMAERGRGHVVAIGSVAGLYATGATLYGATKHAVRGIIRNLRLDMAGSGVRFTDIQPGRVRTEFYDVAVKDEALRGQIKEPGIVELTPEDIAEAVRWVAAQPAHVNISALEVTPTGQAFGGVRFGDPA